MLDDRDIFSLQGRVALVTGGTGEIGRAIAEFFVARGVRTYICSRSRSNCDAAAADLSRAGDCRALPADLSSLAGIRALAAEIAAQEAGLDILVNNAGTSSQAPIEAFTEEAWDDVLDLNLKSIFFTVQALLPLLRRAAGVRAATVINIGSASGKQVSANESYAYSVSKAGLNHLTRKLARRLAAENITVNVVAPGPVAAGMMKQMDQSFQDRVRADIPLGRMATPADVAAAVVFLASRAAAHITGAVLPVDGGVTGCLR